MKSVAIFLIAFIVGVAVGWDEAHIEVATECKKLGTFYVGKQVFICKQKNN